MKRFLSCLAALSVVMSAVVMSAGASAQEPPVLPLEVTDIDAGSYPRVSAVLVAPAELVGIPLEPGAVTVVEDGEAVPVEVVRLPDDQLEVVLVIDTSGSMQGAAFTAAKQAASAFIDLLPADARVALVAFGSTPQVASPLVEDRTALLLALQGLVAQGETALYDAVRLATEQFSGDVDSRRQIVVLSDGGDTASSIPVDQAAAAIAASGASLDVVELVTTESARSALDQLAAAGSGQVAPADDPTALAGIYNGLARSLVSEYSLTWRSSSHDSTSALVRVSQGGIVAELELQLDYPPAPTTTTTPAVAAPPAGPRDEGSAPRNVGWLLVVGGTCAAVALLIFGLNLFVPSQRRRRLTRLGAPAGSARAKPSGLGELAARATAAADGALDRNGRRGVLDRRLEQAGIPLRAGEYVVVGASAIVVAFALGMVLSGLVMALLLAVVAGAATHLVPSVLRGRRQRRFSAQLSDTLQLLAGSLRAGYGLLQAIDAVSREAPEPTSSEFRRLVVETRLGRDLSESLAGMSERLETEDFEWVVQAIDINREVGGDLAEVLDTVASTIRERNTVLRQVRALTAEGRLSAYILLGLPFVLALAMHLLNPDYIRLLTFGPGLLMTAAGAVMLSIGALWFRALCKVDY